MSVPENGNDRKIAKVLLFAVVAIIVLTLAIVVSRAGDIHVAWQPGEGGAPATGFKVYAGTESGVYTEVADVGDRLDATIVLPDGCSTWNIAVTAYNVAGESGYSPEAGPQCSRPIIGEPVASENPGILLIPGNNFCEGVTLFVNGTPVTSVVRDSCESLSLPAADLPVGASTQMSVLQICNGPVCADKTLSPAQAPTLAPTLD